ncbi:MAG: citrate (Si)-synthase [Verrucomicrobia bacterium]|nr:citrate (Si)-synthase [Verrucomicrobiota bacterium]
MSKVLFEITEDNLETGLRGYPIGYCVTSHVDPVKGLHYCGRPISALAYKEPQEVIYLLLHGREGSQKEVEEFFGHLKARSFLPESIVKQITHLPREGSPIKLLSTALLLIEMHDKIGDYRLDCLNVIAKLPHLVACIINHHAGWGPTPKPNFDLGYMEAFTEMVRVPNKSKALREAFKFFNVLHYDHGGGNLSAFVGKAVASGLDDIYGSLSAAMCALAGPRHGSANQVILEFVKNVYEELGDHATEEQVEELIHKRLDRHQLVFGFGHAVLRVEDPRATILYQFVKEHSPDHPLVKIALLLRKAGPKVLKADPKISDPYPNVDAISGTMLVAAGFPYPNYFTLLFGLARCVGIAIQIVYERLEARGGKGTPIVRPKYIYKPR